MTKENGKGTDKPWEKPGQSSQDPTVKPPPKRQVIAIADTVAAPEPR